MTRDEIKNMPAGHDMDYLIAYHVMKYLPTNPGFYTRDIYISFPVGYNASRVEVFKPSTFIQDAWKVIEQVQKIDPYWSPGIKWDDDDGDGNPMWVASFTYYGESETQYRVEEVWDKSAPLAVCRAALLAVMEFEVNAHS